MVIITKLVEATRGPKFGKSLAALVILYVGGIVAFFGAVTVIIAAWNWIGWWAGAALTVAAVVVLYRWATS